jgi:hypothetical protein
MATLLDIIEQVKSNLTPDSPLYNSTEIDFAIEAAINPALQTVSQEVADSDDPSILRKDFTATPTAGVLDLSATSPTDLTPIIVKSLERVGSVRLSSGSVGMIRVNRDASLRSTITNTAEAHHYLIQGRQLLFKNASDNSLTTFVSPIKLTANYVPTLAQLPSQLDTRLIQEIVRRLAPPMVAGGKESNQ